MPAILAIVCVAITAGSHAVAQREPAGDDSTGGGRRATAAESPPTYMGRVIARTMSYHGASWLTREERQREEQPAKLLQSLELTAGQVVCDFGCGNGYYALQLATRVGPTGTVYAVDIQPQMLDLLRERAEPRNLTNIVPVLAEPDDPKLGESKFDLVLMVDVYHELSEPPPVLEAVRRSLRTRGRLAVVEFREEDPDVPIRPLHKMNQWQVVKELTANGLKLVGQFDKLPWQHVLFFARDDSPLEAHALVPWRPTDDKRSVRRK